MSLHADDVTLALADDNATARLGAQLAQAVVPGLVVWLCGDLGAGKTALTRALLRARGIAGPVKSPTYTLVEVHAVSGINFYHFDFYRFNAPEEYLDAGLDEYFDGTGVCLVEWPERAAPYVPPPDVRIDLRVAGDGRRATLSAHSEKGSACLTALRSQPGAICSSLPPPA